MLGLGLRVRLGLRVKGYGLRVTGYGLRVTGSLVLEAFMLS